MNKMRGTSPVRSNGIIEMPLCEHIYECNPLHVVCCIYSSVYVLHVLFNATAEL